MKNTTLILAGLVVLSGCASPKRTTLTGSIKNYDGSPLLIAKETNILRRDTIPVDLDGSFKYELQEKEPMIYYFNFSKTIRDKALIIPGQKFQYEIDPSNKKAEWITTPANLEAFEFMKYFDQNLQSGSIKNVSSFKEIEKLWDERKVAALEKLKSINNKKVKAFYESKIIQNVNLSKLNYAWQLKNQGKKIESDTDYMNFVDGFKIESAKDAKLYLFHKIRVKNEIKPDSSLSGLIHNFNIIKELAPNRKIQDSLTYALASKTILNGNIASQQEADALLSVVNKLEKDKEKLQDFQNRIENSQRLLKGNVAPDFEIINPDGKIMRISDFKGQAIYIDFWASWCIPCRLEGPHLAKLAEKYKDNKDILIMGVSMDKDMVAYKEALIQDKPFWAQFTTSDAGRSIMNTYGFRAIPRFMLIDKEGKMVSADAPRPGELEKITQLINETIAIK